MTVKKIAIRELVEFILRSGSIDEGKTAITHLRRALEFIANCKKKAALNTKKKSG